jgi:hypothetical protein
MLTFFHNTDEYREEFTSQDPRRPCFYWFSDRYFHFPRYNCKYFYLFVKTPKVDNIELRARHDGLDFNALYQWYIGYRSVLENKGVQYAEPAILMSFSKMVPDLTIEFTGSPIREGIIKQTGKSVKIFDDEGNAIPFNQIPEILEALPQIKESIPMVPPARENGKYIYESWNPMITEKMGSWL